MIALHAVHRESSTSEVRQMGGGHQSCSSFVSSDTSSKHAHRYTNTTEVALWLIPRMDVFLLCQISLFWCLAFGI